MTLLLETEGKGNPEVMVMPVTPAGWGAEM